MIRVELPANLRTLAKVGTEITGAVPLVGPFALRLLRGGDEVTGATLTRFYGIHVAVLPLRHPIERAHEVGELLDVLASPTAPSRPGRPSGAGPPSRR